MKVTVKGPKLQPEIIEVEEGIRVSDLLREYESKMPFPIYLSKVDNCYRYLGHILKHDSVVEFLDFSTQAAWVVYQNSLELLYMKAVHDVCGKNALVTISNSLNKGLYTYIIPSVDEETINNIEERMHELVKLDLPIKKEYMSKEEAIKLAESLKLKETKELLDTIDYTESVEIYSLDDEVEIFYDLMVPSTGYLKYFDLKPYRKGVLLRFPTQEKQTELPEYKDQVLLYNAFSESNNWGKLMNVNFVADLNNKVNNKEHNKLFLLQEALHEKRISNIADIIKKEKKRVVLICGPSSSGKTTFSKRLCIQLEVNGLKTLYLGTDDYFTEKNEKVLDEDGDIDLESIKNVDTKLFLSNLKDLLSGKETDLPTFDFINSTKVFGKRITKIDADTVIVIEGIHSLNKILTEGIDDKDKFKIYISPFTPIGIDHHNRIPTTDARMLRRLVRDNQFRGRSARIVIQEWKKVRKSENINIFPYNSEADVFFNSNCIYELAVLKKYAEPLLKQIQRSEEEYAEARRMLNLLRYISTIEEDDDIVNNSIIREFIGGSIIVK